MECPKCKQFNVPAEDCVRCNAPLRYKPVDIVQRIVDALTAYNTLVMCGSAPKLVSASVMASDTYELPAKPNVLYVGDSEYHELRRDHHHSMPDKLGNVYFMGMMVIIVRLEHWLQVTYVRGTK